MKLAVSSGLALLAVPIGDKEPVHHALFRVGHRSGASSPTDHKIDRVLILVVRRRGFRPASGALINMPFPLPSGSIQRRR
jgi:hypothetical protein